MGGKFFLTLGAVGVAFLVLFLVAIVGLEQANARGQELFSRSLAQSQAAADLRGAVDDVSYTTREQTVEGVPPSRVAELGRELRADLVPRIETSIQSLRDLDVEQNQFAAELTQLDTDVASYLALEDDITQSAGGAGIDPTAAMKVRTVLSRMALRADQMRTKENAEAAESEQRAEDDHQSTLAILIGGGAAAFIGGVIGVLLLIRNLVPRIRAYSRFATEVVAGKPSSTLHPRGRDELAELGHALNAMVTSNASRARRDEIQAEFVGTLQRTSTEDEAHQLVQDHIERLVPAATASVLKRNNSANRLQAATRLPSEDTLVERLLGAEPRTCLALRFGGTHVEGGDQPALLRCELCERPTGRSTCEPLLVGGEVIGAVLVRHAVELSGAQLGQIKTSITQAAPVLANLRNLALAEFRANNDALTGLPNKRATDDNLKRMVAQANRSRAPLTAIMLDLDNFKPINDRFGHGKGDEVLAAVGAALQSSLRASDFAGRFGGEEFLVLLPDTSGDEAVGVAEKVRRTIAAITVAGVDLPISASLGVAEVPLHAVSGTTLLREADRALYEAKGAGRNRVAVARLAGFAQTGSAQARSAEARSAEAGPREEGPAIRGG